ncbi:acyl-CoA dehydrogenase family protein [Smaragdicoccus niigatensis]|uniref:acyl-CoA dehydrogenase family protein n=1 Tax=Smaragdicoccus niigatensis TaxID=359359 RepID=UPI00037DE99C|nr:acyl-CoA dehydrogenase family protein [Smaragdicoccus niigatensis]
MWDFTTEPEFQKKLDWMDTFVREEVEPLDLAFPERQYQKLDDEFRKIINPLKDQVRAQGLWACALDGELGGQGYGQLKLALMNEILGRSLWAPVVFGCQAPDTGNAEILAIHGTEGQKALYLQPLLDGELFSAFSMTEPQAGADPRLFITRAIRNGDDWVINGEKYFTSNARNADFLIVMAVTDPDAHPLARMSMFIVPTDTPGIEFLRDFGVMGEPTGRGLHAHLKYTDVRVGADALLGPEGAGFVIAQERLGGGRLHHSMRTVASVKKALDMLCERALSRTVSDGILADKQLVQAAIADCYLDIAQFRLLVLHTSWLCDQVGTSKARAEISACKIAAGRVYRDVVYRSMHIHGALGVSNETPLGKLWLTAPLLGIMDGPDEVHQQIIARQVLKGYKPAPGAWPTQFLPDLTAAARAKYGLQLGDES